MKFTPILATWLTLSATVALAHSEKEGTVPADGTVVEAVPENIELRFNDGMRLTKVEMTHAEKHTEALELGEQSGFVKKFSLPMISMGAGFYLIEWRGLGVDGHPMDGSFSFEVK